jgi:hypothetical protein
MAAAESRKALLTALFLMALAALLLHLRIHPVFAPDKANPGQMLFRPSFIPATLLPLLDVFVVTALFASRRTAVYGHLFNGLIVIYGTVLMGHFSIAGLLPKDPALTDWILKSTFPDIALAWADFAIGAVLYRSWMAGD